MASVNAVVRLREAFASQEAFESCQTEYQLAPFRFTRIPGVAGHILVVNEVGEYHLLPESTFERFHQHLLKATDSTYQDLRSKHFLLDRYAHAYWPFAVSQYKTRKLFLKSGPALHIVVVTLRCDHSCPYCQVSRREEAEGASRFDLSEEHARLAIERILESPAKAIKIEFQGGEPLLAFDRIKCFVEEVKRRVEGTDREVEFVIASTLNTLSVEQLEFCKEHSISLSTSLDGPEQLHNRNRPRRHRDSYARTLAGIAMAREVLGHDSVSALVTVIRESLALPEAIIDTYAQFGFRSIFLRSLSPYGFAVNSRARIGYTVGEFLEFYDRALAHLIRVNQRGVYLEESYTTLLLQHVLTPFASGYVDLRSPTGAMLGALVYNYDGDVYASDEGRMLAEAGDRTFRLGSVRDSYHQLLSSEAAMRLMEAGVAEALPGCCDCAFLPYCGADPVHHRATQGRLEGHRATSDFCLRQTGLFQRLFRRLARPIDDDMSDFVDDGAQPRATPALEWLTCCRFTRGRASMVWRATPYSK